MTSLKLKVDDRLGVLSIDVSGASLDGKGPIELTILHLKRWLQCRGTSTKGKKPDQSESLHYEWMGKQHH